jgi:hypothetical protein
MTAWRCHSCLLVSSVVVCQRYYSLQGGPEGELALVCLRFGTRGCYWDIRMHICFVPLIDKFRSSWAGFKFALYLYIGGSET